MAPPTAPGQAGPPSRAAAPLTFITGATVVDGTGAPGFAADVVLQGGTISGIDAPGTHAGEPGAIDAAGLVLCPGFIDMHAHSDLALLTDPGHYAKLSQGVTTELLGQDGLSYAPVDGPVLAAMREKIAGWNGNPAGFDFSWRGVGEYLDRLDRGIAVNAAYLVPQGTVRAMVCGLGDTPASPEQVAAQQELVRTAMAEGAVGMSSGLSYTPGMYAGRGELEALCTAVAEAGGFYAPHHRSYGAGALEAYADMIDLAWRTGCPLHLAHATMNFAPNKGRAPELLELLDAALDDGVDLTLDTYPYLPGATTLSAVLPGWASAGGNAATLDRLRDPAQLARIRHDVEVAGSDGCHGVAADWDSLEISGVGDPDLAGLVGRTVAEIAKDSGRDGFAAFVDILLRDGLATGVLQHVGHEENVRAIMVHRAHTGGSDGILAGAKPHPRAWGTFPRYLGRYSRELGLMTLEETVHHLTGRPAARLKLRDRGLVRAGWAADLVLFDPDTVADTATFANPRQAAEGIHYVIVNGAAAIAAGGPTGTLAGRALRHTPEGTRSIP